MKALPVSRYLNYSMPNGVKAFSTKRMGGYGIGSYATFNMNPYCGDDPQRVRANRCLLCRDLGISESQLFYPHQVHGDQICVIPAPVSNVTNSVSLEGIDSLITSCSGICIGVFTADCVPVLLYDVQKRIIAAVHAGWRGTLSRIVEKTVCRMRDVYGTSSVNLVACVGPSISFEAFEVGDEVYDLFESAGFSMQIIADRQNGKWHLDLWKANVLQLIAEGVPSESISLAGICTHRESDTFFSARKMGINSGRIFSGIMME